METYSPDADTENADWTKQSWDFPAYKSREFFEAAGTDLDAFRRSPAYAGAVAAGLIHDDEWVADYAVPAPASDRPRETPARPRVHIHVHRGKK